jgi:hypothetical protein
MNDKEERIWKEVVVAYEGIILTPASRDREKHHQDSQRLGQYSNRGPAAYNSEYNYFIAARPTCSGSPFEKLIVFHVVNKFILFYAIKTFISVFT